MVAPLVPFDRGPRVPRKPVGDAHHAAFHRTAGQAALGAAAATLVLDLACRWLGVDLDRSAWLPLGILAGSLGAVGVGARGPRVLRHLLGLVIGVGAGGAFALMENHWAPFGALLMGAGMVPALAPEGGWGRRAASAAIAGALGAAGIFVGRVLLGWDVFEPLVPGPLGAAAAGAAAGLFVGIGGAGRHLAPPEDPVEARFRALLHRRDGEITDLLQRALRHYRNIGSDLRTLDEPGFKSELQRVMLQLAAAAEQMRQLEKDLLELPPSELEQRAAELQHRADLTRDPVARKTFEEAARSLQDEVVALDRIGRGRERVLARLHADVALLERVRFSLLQLRSASAEQAKAHHSAASAQLEALREGLEATSSALSHVYGEDVLPALESGTA